jgi:hypothetical protein
MITKIKRILLTVAAVFALALPALVPASAFAASNNAIAPGLNCGADLKLNVNGGNNCNPTNTNTDFSDLLTKAINIFSVIVGVIAVIMIIVGGLKYITSGGESSNVSGAKNTIIYAIIGLVVVALAQFIVRFVLNNTPR